ncbi:unnamed protein product [Brassica oleracea var. botrytis]
MVICLCLFQNLLFRRTFHLKSFGLCCSIINKLRVLIFGV